MVNITIQESNLNLNDIQVRSGKMLPQNFQMPTAYYLNKPYLWAL